MGRRARVDQTLILNTAAELAEEEGADRVTLQRLAARLGIRPPSLYNHIRGLEELSANLARFAVQKLEETLRNAAVGRAREDALREIARSYRAFAKENPELYKAILKVPADEEGETREAFRTLPRVLRQVLEPYQYDEEDEAHFARAFRSALHGFVSLEQAGFFKGPFDPDISFNRLVDGLISTLTPPHRA